MIRSHYDGILNIHLGVNLSQSSQHSWDRFIPRRTYLNAGNLVISVLYTIFVPIQDLPAKIITTQTAPKQQSLELKGPMQNRGNPNHFSFKQH